MQDAQQRSHYGCDKQKLQPWPTAMLDCTSTDSRSPLFCVTGILRIPCWLPIPGMSQTFSHTLGTWPNCWWLPLSMSGPCFCLTMISLPSRSCNLNYPFSPDRRCPTVVYEFQDLTTFIFCMTSGHCTGKGRFLFPYFPTLLSLPHFKQWSTSRRKWLFQIYGTVVHHCQALLLQVWSHILVLSFELVVIQIITLVM